MKMLIQVALLASLAAPLAWSAGTVHVYTPDGEKPKTLTNAEHLLDLVGQPRLANSWWPGAVIGERQATVKAEQEHLALLARLTGLAEQEDGDDAAAINNLRQQLQALKVTGRQQVNLDPDECALRKRATLRSKGITPSGYLPSLPPLPFSGLSAARGKSLLRLAAMWRAISMSKAC